MFEIESPIPYQYLPNINGIQICVKRIDLVHPTISGNKFFKLKYNFLTAQQQGYQQLLSFGGAYSNHVDALAHAAHDYNFENIIFIRGEELQYQPLNSTLARAHALGTKLHFLSRAQYRIKHTPEFLEKLKHQFPNAYIIPEGGSNALAVKGCEEILSAEDKKNFDMICCAAGTGGTMAGIINASHDHQQIIGFSALKGTFLEQTIRHFTHKTNWQLISDDSFGGYAKFNGQLLEFIHQINEQYHLPLEPIYTGKALYQLFQFIQQQQIQKYKRILFIHTGGLQAFDSAHQSF